MITIFRIALIVPMSIIATEIHHSMPFYRNAANQTITVHAITLTAWAILSFWIIPKIVDKIKRNQQRKQSR